MECIPSINFSAVLQDDLKVVILYLIVITQLNKFTFGMMHRLADVLFVFQLFGFFP